MYVCLHAQTTRKYVFVGIILAVTDQSFSLTTRCMDEKRFYHLCLCRKLLFFEESTDNRESILHPFIREDRKLQKG